MLASCAPKGESSLMLDWKSNDSGKILLEDNRFILESGQTATYNGRGSGRGYSDFEISGFIALSPGSVVTLMFHTDKTGKGYELVFHNGPVNGTLKTGSLTGVRNLYKSVSKDGDWTSFILAVIDKHISLYVDGIEVASYIEPENPYRTGEFTDRLLGRGNFVLSCKEGPAKFQDFNLNLFPRDHEARVNALTMPVIDEQSDRIIRMQQAMFPVIDYHVHLKGMDRKEVQAKSLSYGIEYGIAPNCGIGFPITNDDQVSDFVIENYNAPFLLGMQGEGREWVTTFSQQSRNLFNYVFTDAMTFTDHKNRRTRLWMDEEVFIDIPQEQYMDIIVDKIVKVLDEEPIDIYVNPTFLPTAMEADYDKLWTDARIDRVVKALKANNIALEINARYRIPNFKVIKAAKDAGIRFTFGTNNGDADMGKLEYCMEAVDACGLTAADMWFPSYRTIRR